MIVFSTISLGLPIPVGIVPAEKIDRDANGDVARFPCENSPCGCKSATRCWDTCCCKSDSQKIAWAEANNVTPPKFLVARVDRTASEKTASHNSPTRSCCQKKLSVVPTTMKNSCCQQESKPKSCCQKKPVLANSKANKKAIDKKSEGEAQPETRLDLVMLDALQRCNGIEGFWKLIQISVVEPFPVHVQRNNPLCLGNVFIHDDLYASYLSEPDGPVPRAAAFAI